MNLKHFFSRNFLAQCLLLALFSVLPALQSCKHEEMAQTETIDPVKQALMEKVTSAIKNNPKVFSDMIVSLRAAIETQNQSVSLRGSEEQVDGEALAIMEKYQNKPDALVALVARESYGSDVLALVDAVMSISDEATIDARVNALRQYLPKGVVELVRNNSNSNSTELISKQSFREAVEEADNSNSSTVDKSNSSPVGLRSCPYDCKMHILAGASVALAGGCVAFAILKWFAPAWVRALVLVGVGIAAAIVVGAAKEIYDLVTGRGTPEWRDFWNTVIGGAAGGSLAALVVQVSTKFALVSNKSVTCTAVTLGIFAIATGYCPGINLLSSGRRSC